MRSLSSEGPPIDLDSWDASRIPTVLTGIGRLIQDVVQDRDRLRRENQSLREEIAMQAKIINALPRRGRHG